MKRYTGTLVMDTGYVGASHEAEYEFECEESEYDDLLEVMADQMKADNLDFFTKDEAVEEVEE